jgi:hypothetical protein
MRPVFTTVQTQDGLRRFSGFYSKFMMVRIHNDFKHLTQTLGWAQNTRTALWGFNLLVKLSYRVELKARIRKGGGIDVDIICGLIRVSNTYLTLCPNIDATYLRRYQGILKCRIHCLPVFHLNTANISDNVYG